MKKTAFFISISLITSSASFAQKTGGDTTLKSTTIEVIQSYKPEVKQVPRQVFTPDLPPADTTRPRFQYEVPQQMLNYTYAALPLRPLALSKDTLTQPFPGYIKLGGGNLSTIYLDAGIGNIKGKNYTSSLHLHHISQQGNRKNQKTASSGFEAEGFLHTDQLLYHASVEGARNSYFRYGGQFDPANPGNAPQLEYTGLQVSADAKNEKENAQGINYHPSVSAWFYGRNFSADEMTFSFALPVSKDIDENMNVSAGITGIITSNVVTSGNHFYNNIFSVTPKFTYHTEDLAAHIGLYPTFGQGGNSYLLPDLGVVFKPAQKKFSLTAGWQAQLRQNTYRELTTRNPFLALTYATAQTRTDEVYAGINTGIGNHLSFSGRVSVWQYGKMPLFLNDNIDQKTFYLVYDNQVNAISFSGSLRYDIANTFSAGIAASFYNYYKSTYSRVWHEPTVRLNADIAYRPVPQLSIGGYLHVLDGIYVVDELQHEKKLDAIFDAGLSVEYNFIPRLSVFFNVNNIFNSTYQRWYTYDSYGANVYGGLRLKF